MSSVFEVNVKLRSVEYPKRNFGGREISGIIAFVQDTVEGTLSFSCTKETSLKLMSKFYGTAYETINDQVIDGISEVTNMIHGIVREELNKSGFKFDMCLPVVVVGNQHYVFSTVAGNRILLEFTTLFGPIFAEIVIYSNS